MTDLNFLSMLYKYSNICESNKNVVDRAIKFINENQDSFERTNLSGHFTGSAWIITNDNQRALVTHHKKLRLILHQSKMNFFVKFNKK